MLKDNYTNDTWVVTDEMKKSVLYSLTEALDDWYAADDFYDEVLAGENAEDLKRYRRDLLNSLTEFLYFGKVSETGGDDNV